MTVVTVRECLAGILFFVTLCAALSGAVLCPVPAYAQGGDYRIQAEDVLLITVYEHDDLKTRARVSSDGDITFPLLGKVNIAGLSVSEVEDLLSTELEKDYLVLAQVQVFIEQYHQRQVSVLGAVNKPGKYDLHTEKSTTVLDAIAMAGDFSKVAAINGTRVIRTENGRERNIRVRVTDITRRGKKDKDIILQPGDVIIVPESFF